MNSNNNEDVICDGHFEDWRNHVLFAPLEILVPGSKPLSINATKDNDAKPSSIPLLHTNTPLSFWGGIDPETSQIIDMSHPLYSPTDGHGATKTSSDNIQNNTNSTRISNTVLCLPSGRGSCTASQALLELILNNNAPNAIILKEVDSILCVGSIVAREVFGDEVLGNGDLDEGNNGGKAPLIAKILDRDERDWSWMPPSLHQSNSSNSKEISSLFSAIGRAGFSHASIILLAPENNQTKENQESSTEEPRTGGMAILVAATNPNYLRYGTSKIYSTTESTPISFPPLAAKSKMKLTSEESFLLDGSTSNLSTQAIQELSKKYTPAHTLAMKIICQVAQIQNATRLQKVTRAHIDGCTYVGEGGRRFVRRLVELSGINGRLATGIDGNNSNNDCKDGNGKYKTSILAVPTTLNSISTDIRNWKVFGIPAKKSHPAQDVAESYLKLGCHGDSLTCAPYLVQDFTPTEVGEHVVWGESNAVVYANSVLGARTNKTADYLDICSALIGRSPFTGVHTDQERWPRVVLDGRELMTECVARMELEEQGHSENDAETREHNRNIAHWDSIFPVLGYICGHLSDGKVPLILLDPGGTDEPIDRRYYPTNDDLKAFCAAFGTTGTAPLFHIARVTPEATDDVTIRAMMDSCLKDGVNNGWKTIGWRDLKKGYRDLNCATDGNVDSLGMASDDGKEYVKLVALGNPHLSLSECKTLHALTSRPTSSSGALSDSGMIEKHPGTRIIVTLGRRVHKEASQMGYLSSMQQFGVEFINDTCWCMLLDHPVIPPLKTDIILTNSAKLAHYGPGLTDRCYRFGSMKECVDASVLGYRLRRETTLPPWLPQTRTYSSSSAGWKMVSPVIGRFLRKLW